MPASLADLLNSPTEVEFEGAVYKLRAAAVREYGEFQKWLEASAREAAGRADDLPPDVYDRLLRHVTRDIAAKVYAFGGDGFATAVDTAAGFSRLLYLCLRNDGYDVTPELVDRMAEHKMRELAAAVSLAGEDDPKVVRAVCEVLGLSRLPDWRPPSSGSPTPPSESPSSNSGGSPSDSSTPSTSPSSGTSGGPPN